MGPSTPTDVGEKLGTTRARGSSSVGHQTTDADERQILQRIEAKVRAQLFEKPHTVARLGRFTVLEELGQGGMGTVYAAYDEQLDRKVAVKVLHQAELPGKSTRLRFQREAQALARLSHANVVTIHEVGESDGQMFLAMEFIRGQSFSAWLDGELGWADVLDAFVQAGRGLMAAHDADLVHRDFKPLNVMRGEDGVVKVLDFGLVRGMGEDSLLSSDGSESGGSVDSSLTVPGTTMGTPPYMSPEQHRGEAAGAASDQYSFCLSVWEGLTGRHPFGAFAEGNDFLVKLEGPPPWPSSAPPVPRHIVEALERGMSPDPNDRWPNMAGLLEALSWQPRRRRDRWWQGLAAVGLVAIGGVGLYAWAQVQGERCSGARGTLSATWNDARRDEIEASILGLGRPYARDVWTRAERELSAYADEWVELHTEACEATTVRGEQSVGVMDLRMECLRRAAFELDTTVDMLADADPIVVLKAHELTAGLPPLSRCSDVEALAAEVEPPLPAEAEAVEKARTMLSQATALRRVGRYEAGLAMVREAQTMLVDVNYQPILIDVGLLEGQLLDPLGEYRAADAALSRTLELALRAGDKHQATEAARSLAFVVGLRLHRVEEGLRYEPIARGSSDDPSDELKIRFIVARIWESSGRHEEAEAEFRAIQGLHHTFEVTTALGMVLAKRGRYEEAEVEFRKALADKEDALGSAHPETATTRSNLAGILSAQGKDEEAEAEVRAVLAIYERSLEPDHPDVVRAWMNLALTLGSQEKYTEAEATYRATLLLQEDVQGANHPDVGLSRLNLALTLEHQGKNDAALAELEVALSIYQEVWGVDHPDTALCNLLIGDILITEERLEDALPYIERAWARFRRGEDQPKEAARAAFKLAQVLWGLDEPSGDRSRALKLAEEARQSYGEIEHGDEVEVQRWLDARRLE